jgi:hypothetical protein
MGKMDGLDKDHPRVRFLSFVWLMDVVAAGGHLVIGAA